jgi:hypothetical protein
MPERYTKTLLGNSLGVEGVGCRQRLKSVRRREVLSGKVPCPLVMTKALFRTRFDTH